MLFVCLCAATPSTRLSCSAPNHHLAVSPNCRSTASPSDATLRPAESRPRLTPSGYICIHNEGRPTSRSQLIGRPRAVCRRAAPDSPTAADHQRRPQTLPKDTQTVAPSGHCSAASPDTGSGCDLGGRCLSGRRDNKQVLIWGIFARSRANRFAELTHRQASCRQDPK